MVNHKDLLDSLNPEKKQEQKEIKLKKNPQLELIIKAWESSVRYDYNINCASDFYFNAKTDTSTQITFDYSQMDMTEFISTLSAYEKILNFSEKAGLFISALIQNSSFKKITLTTEHFSKPLHYLGFANQGRHINIVGNAGNYAGCFMDSGIMVITGNADVAPGLCFEGGLLIVYGNSGILVGENQSGGEINLYADYKSIGFTRRGSIYHYGKLINKNGRDIKW